MPQMRRHPERYVSPELLKLVIVCAFEAWRFLVVVVEVRRLVGLYRIAVQPENVNRISP